MRPARATALALSVLLAPAPALTGCARPPDVAPAPRASEAACAAALRRLPETLLGARRRDLDVPGAAAWGDPAIVLRCGLDELAPSTLPCIGVDDLDWVIDETPDGVAAASYGRSPALELLVPPGRPRERVPAALADLAPAVRELTATGRTCVDEDV